MARKRPDGSLFDSLNSILSGPVPPPRLQALDTARALVKAIEDRRRFHPLYDLRPAGAVSRSSRRLQVATGTLPGRFPPAGLSFSVPRDVSICVRRKERRSVIFAKGKSGKGSRSRRRRNGFSDIGC